VRDVLRSPGKRVAEALLTGAFHREEEGHKGGACRDADGDHMLQAMLDWLRAWARKQFGDTRRSAGEAAAITPEGTLDRLDKYFVRVALDLIVQLGGPRVAELEEEEEETRCAGGRLQDAKRRAAESTCRPQGTAVGLDPLAEIGEEVADLVADKMHGDQAAGTARAYTQHWARWRWWATQHRWQSPYLMGETKWEKIRDEECLLAFAGFLAWLGFATGTIKQSLFAIRAEHKRGGAGDPLEGADRVWILLKTLELGNPAKPRKLGVTSEMMDWASGAVLSEEAEERIGIDELRDPGNRLVLDAALKTGYFYLCRASEYVRSGIPDYGKIMRGLDVRLKCEGESAQASGQPDRLDVQFRKTKADQAAFGCVRTHYRVADGPGRKLCVVEAIGRMREAFPERRGPEGPLPLFRWRSGALVRREDLQKVLGRAAEAVGLPPARFRSHSLRIGGASAMLHATNQFDLVKRFGRWSSDAVHGYLHESAEQWRGLAEKMACDRSAVHYT